MNIELIKYKSSGESRILYILVSGVDGLVGIPVVILKQVGLIDVIVPPGDVTWFKGDGNSSDFITNDHAYIIADLSNTGGINKSGLMLVSVQVDTEIAECPVYRKEEILAFKMDMMNILASNNINEEIAKYYTRFLFFESGLNDAVKYSDITEAYRFYSGLKDLVGSFKTKYYYNEKG